MPKSFKFKSLHVGILKDQKDARLKIKHDGTFRHNFRALGEARHNFPCRAYVEPIFAVERRGQPHQAVQDPTEADDGCGEPGGMASGHLYPVGAFGAPCPF